MHAGSPTEWRLFTGADAATFDFQDDGEFCAHARTDVPALLALVETLAESLALSHGCATLRPDGTCDGCHASSALGAYTRGPEP